MELKKSLTALGVFALGAGAMVSSGLFILPSLAFTSAGKWALLSYALAGLCMLPAVFTKLELTSAIPRAGGAFFYLTRILGAPVGMIAGFADWFSVSLKSAFALVGIGIFGAVLVPGLDPAAFRYIAIGASVVFTLLNIMSVEGTGRFQVAMVMGLLAILLAYVAVGYREMDFVRFTEGRSFELLPVIATTGMIFVSYGGITKIASAVEEVKDAKTMLVPGIMAAFITVQIVYLLVVFVTIGAMDGTALAESATPLTDAVDGFFSSPIVATIGRMTLAAAGILAFFTTANAGILSASRIPLSMSRDGLLPKALGGISRRSTPVPAILATEAFMVAIILGLDVSQLAKVASLFLMLIFFLENLGLIVIRLSKVSTYRPIFRTPLFPVMQVFGLVVYGVLIVSQGIFVISVAAAFVLLAFVWYLIYARKGWSKTSALVSMVRRLSGPELENPEADLEEELLSILIERDNIKEDRFDRVIRNAPVIDYDETVSQAQVFDDVAALVQERYGFDASHMKDKLLEREDQSTTLIGPGVAVPHAIPRTIVDGDSVFEIILVRNKYGIKWTGDEVVYTAFFLIASQDERNFHLRALMFLAQILQDHDFNRTWHAAGNERAMRAALILSERKREGHNVSKMSPEHKGEEAP